MSKQPLVSIIIPTFNRAHLIGETLDSVLAQTYKNWECIIVDDGSSDKTDEVVNEYVKKDSRFKYYNRPDEHLPGGNGARNYGFKMSQGEFVNWFDSDDLMLPEKIEINFKILIDEKKKFIIDKFKNFEDSVEIQNYEIDIKEINVRNYILLKEFWGTCNMFINRKLIENLTFNEYLKSGQEYNFFVKLILQKNISTGLMICNPLVLRRIHRDSIQQIQKDNSIEKSENKFFVFWETYKETKDLLNIQEKKFLVKSFLGYYFSLITKNKIVIKPLEIVRKTRKNKSQSILLLSILYSFIITKLGYNKSRLLYLNLL